MTDMCNDGRLDGLYHLRDFSPTLTIISEIFTVFSGRVNAEKMEKKKMEARRG